VRGYDNNAPYDCIMQAKSRVKPRAIRLRGATPDGDLQQTKENIMMSYPKRYSLYFQNF
jgi:hypothetical protein